MNISHKVIFLWAMAMVSQNTMSQNTLDFDGTDDKIDCGDDTSIRIIGKALTLEAWIYPTAWKTNIYDGNVINKEYNTSNYGYMLRVGASGKLNFAIGDGTWRELNSTNAVLSLNTWQHIAGTYDGTKMRIYVDGVAVDSTTTTISISNAIGTPLILGGHTNYVRYYQGMMDEVKIWNRCLSEKQLNDGMTKEICAKTPGLKAYYKFNQGKASQNNPNVKKLTDLSGFYNHGTLTGFSLVGSGSNWVKGRDFKKDATNVSDTVDVCDRLLSPSRKITWTKSGIYYDTIPTVVMGCDSALTIYLTVKKSTSQTINAFACNSYVSPSGSYTWTKSGIYTEKLYNKAKCDSTVTVNLKIGGSRDTITRVVCKSYKTPSGKKTFTISGIYADTLKGFGGCDSIFVIKLTVYKQSFITISEKVCNAYLSPSGKTYMQSGTYIDTLVNYTGCDSIITIKLEIMRSSSSISRTACNQFKSPSGKYTWTQSGIYQDIIVNQAGCDSVMSIQLTIHKTSYATLPVSACRSFTSPGKKRIWNSSGTYMDTMINQSGCDSVITINLSITTINTGVTQNISVLTAVSTSGTYQWLDCNQSMGVINGETNRIFKAKVIGDYAVAITENNCSDTSTCYKVSSIVGLESHKLPAFKLMPNPGRGIFEIVLPVECANAVVRVMDISGRIVFEQSYQAFSQGVIELNEVSGLYFIEIDSPQYKAVQCLAIER